jgi:pimeloyl-ACP methyl ester carboxylesterase
MSRPIKPSIVFCHGIWADGSCFSKVIPVLQAEGHEVMAVQYGLDTFTDDVAAIKRTLGRVSSPAILVGHSLAEPRHRSRGWTRLATCAGRHQVFRGRPSRTGAEDRVGDPLRARRRFI